MASTDPLCRQEERVGAWIEHLERWDKDGLGAAPTDPVKELARAGIPHRLRHEVYNHLARVHDNKEKHPGLYGQYCARIEASCSAKVPTPLVRRVCPC